MYIIRATPVSIKLSSLCMAILTPGFQNNSANMTVEAVVRVSPEESSEADRVRTLYNFLYKIERS